jgi:hypothetical protein
MVVMIQRANENEETNRLEHLSLPELIYDKAKFLQGFYPIAAPESKSADVEAPNTSIVYRTCLQCGEGFGTGNPPYECPVPECKNVVHRECHAPTPCKEKSTCGSRKCKAFGVAWTNQQRMERADAAAEAELLEAEEKEKTAENPVNEEEMAVPVPEIPATAPAANDE